MKRADLHTHTVFSDGALRPAELVEEACRAGLQAIAITDHDAVEGVSEGVEAGCRLGITVVPGVEINTDMPGTEVHMLGYYVDAGSEALRESLRRLREGRLLRAGDIVARLRASGVPVRLERVLEIADGVGAVGRPHVAEAIVELGRADDIRDAFEKYLKRGRPGYVPRPKFAPEQAIAVIREAGGVPVLAHPALSRCDERIADWVHTGLRGLEVDHSRHMPEEVTRYRQMADTLGLIATAGSDFHGLPSGDVALGERTCGMDVIDRLREESARILAGFD